MDKYNSCVFNFLANMQSTYNIKPNENMIVQTGGYQIEDKKYKFIDNGGLYTFNCHIKDNADSTQISILSKSEQDCGIIYIDKNEKIAILCAKEGLKKPGGGTILLRFILNMIVGNRKKYNVNRIVLTDNSYITCKNCSENIKLSRLKILLKGSPWYMKFGFQPYDAYKKKPSHELSKALEVNRDIIKKLKTKDIDVITFSKNLNMDVKHIQKLADKYTLMRDFIIELLYDHDTNCCLVERILKELFNPVAPKKSTLYDFHGKQFYIDI